MYDSITISAYIGGVEKAITCKVNPCGDSYKLDDNCQDENGEVYQTRHYFRKFTQAVRNRARELNKKVA